jgi:hypothetical protein
MLSGATTPGMMPPMRQHQPSRITPPQQQGVRDAPVSDPQARSSFSPGDGMHRVGMRSTQARTTVALTPPSSTYLDQLYANLF